MRHVPLLALLTILCPHVALPAGPDYAYTEPRGYVCYRAASPVAIDGRLDDAAWRDAPWTDDFVDIEGDKKPSPALRTRAKMLWDDEYFYIAAEMEEPHVWATLTRARLGHLPRQRLRGLHRPRRRQPRVLRVRDQRARHRLGPAPAEAVQGRRQGGQRLGDPGPEDGGPRRRHAERPARHRPRLDGRDRVAVGGARRSWRAATRRRATATSGGSTSRASSGSSRWSTARYGRSPDASEDNWVWSPQGVIDMHRPERGATCSSRPRGPGATFRPDPTLPARRWLHEVYYAQREFRKKNERWATSLEELGWRTSRGWCTGGRRLGTAGTQLESTVKLGTDGREERAVAHPPGLAGLGGLTGSTRFRGVPLGSAGFCSTGFRGVLLGSGFWVLGSGSAGFREPRNQNPNLQNPEPCETRGNRT